MGVTFDGNDPVLIDDIKLPPLPKPIYEISFPVYTIPSSYEALANDKGWSVHKINGTMLESVAEKKFTNFERLRTLDIEQMADELFDLFATFYCVEWSKKVLTEWLKQEIEGEANETTDL